ncbi:MFS transporter [Aminobacter sp. Piv2-1]|uniref:MFS transporter n=1 Tax=Aminobacter sp. Piv2-1 TaxID=3031122 RepID=UPI0030B6DC1B
MFAFRLKHVPTPGEGLPLPERTIAAVAVLMNVCMANLDVAIANTALPTIARDIGATDAQSIWVVSAYQLAMAASLLPAAALGEIIGLRRISMCGLILFTLASLICGLAPSLEWLVAGRILQGVSASGILGIGLAMTRFIFPQSMLGRGMGLNAFVVAISFAAGPSAASAILSMTSWHWLFLINVPIGIVGIAMGLYALPATPRSTRRFDGLAAGLCATFLASTVFALGTATQGARWTTPALAALVAASSLALLMRRQAGSPAPILAVDLLRRPMFGLSVLTSFLAFFAQTVAFVSLPFMLQALYGYSQVETGFLITPWPAAVALAAPLAGRLSDRVPAGTLGGVGLVVLSLGLVLLATLPNAPTTIDIAWRMAFCGFGYGLFQSPNMRAIMTAVPRERSGSAGGMSSVCGVMGQSFGAGLVAALFTSLGSPGAAVAMWVAAAAALLGSMASLSRLGVTTNDATEQRPAPTDTQPGVVVAGEGARQRQADDREREATE